MRRRTLLLICGLMSILAVNPLVSDAEEYICTVTNSADGYNVFGGPIQGTLRGCVKGMSYIQYDKIVFEAGITNITLVDPIVIYRDRDMTIDAGEQTITISGDNANKVFYIDSAADVTMRNLKIVDGKGSEGDDVQGDPAKGGGILNKGRLTLDGCEVSNSSAHLGGGIFNDDGATLIMIDCRITNNHGLDAGGGIANYRNPDTNSVTDSRLENCVISENSSGIGAGIYNNARLNMKGCTISKNVSSDEGGGLMNGNYGGAAYADLIDCIFSENESTGYRGGGIANYSEMQLLGCEFSNNRATDAGGIYNSENASLRMTECLVTGNRTSGYGGGIFNNYKTNESEPGICVLKDCILKENEALAGGGIYSEGDITITGSELVDNLAVDAGERRGQGAGILNRDGRLTLTDCTLRGNRSYYGPALMNYDETDDPERIPSCVLTNVTLTGNQGDPDHGAVIAQVFGTPSMSLINCTVANNRNAEEGIAAAGTLTLKNTIVAFNGPDGTTNFQHLDDGVITSEGYNLSNDWNEVTPAATDLTADPRLEPLSACADGPMVHTLGADSPAIDAGTYEDAPDRDQCGKLRFGVWDIGAWESPLMRMGLREALMALQISVGLAPAHRIKVDPIACWLDVSGDERVGLAEAAYALRLTGQSTPLIDPPCQSFEFSNDRVSFYGSIYRCGVVDYKGSAKFVLADDRDIGGSQDITEGEFCYSAEAPYQTVENCLYLLGNCLKTKGSYKASGQTVSTWDDQVTCFGQ